MHRSSSQNGKGGCNLTKSNSGLSLTTMLSSGLSLTTMNNSFQRYITPSNGEHTPRTPIDMNIIQNRKHPDHNTAQQKHLRFLKLNGLP